MEAANTVGIKPPIVAYKPQPFGDVYLTLLAKSFNHIRHDYDGDFHLGTFEEGYILLRGFIPLHTHPDCGLNDMPIGAKKAYSEIYELDRESVSSRSEVRILICPTQDIGNLSYSHSVFRLSSHQSHNCCPRIFMRKSITWWNLGGSGRETYRPEPSPFFIAKLMLKTHIYSICQLNICQYL